MLDWLKSSRVVKIQRSQKHATTRTLDKDSARRHVALRSPGYKFTPKRFPHPHSFSQGYTSPITILQPPNTFVNMHFSTPTLAALGLMVMGAAADFNVYCGLEFFGGAPTGDGYYCHFYGTDVDPPRYSTLRPLSSTSTYVITPLLTAATQSKIP